MAPPPSTGAERDDDGKHCSNKCNNRNFEEEQWRFPLHREKDWEHAYAGKNRWDCDDSYFPSSPSSTSSASHEGQGPIAVTTASHGWMLPRSHQDKKDPERTQPRHLSDRRTTSRSDRADGRDPDAGSDDDFIATPPALRRKMSGSSRPRDDDQQTQQSQPHRQCPISSWPADLGSKDEDDEDEDLFAALHSTNASKDPRQTISGAPNATAWDADATWWMNFDQHQQETSPTKNTSSRSATTRMPALPPSRRDIMIKFPSIVDWKEAAAYEAAAVAASQVTKRLSPLDDDPFVSPAGWTNQKDDAMPLRPSRRRRHRSNHNASASCVSSLSCCKNSNNPRRASTITCCSEASHSTATTVATSSTSRSNSTTSSHPTTLPRTPTSVSSSSQSNNATRPRMMGTAFTTNAPHGSPMSSRKPPLPPPPATVASSASYVSSSSDDDSDDHDDDIDTDHGSAASSRRSGSSPLPPSYHRKQHAPYLTQRSSNSPTASPISSSSSRRKKDSNESTKPPLQRNKKDLEKKVPTDTVIVAANPTATSSREPHHGWLVPRQIEESSLSNDRDPSEHQWLVPRHGQDKLVSVESEDHDALRVLATVPRDGRLENPTSSSNNNPSSVNEEERRLAVHTTQDDSDARSVDTFDRMIAETSQRWSVSLKDLPAPSSHSKETGLPSFVMPATIPPPHSSLNPYTMQMMMANHGVWNPMTAAHSAAAAESGALTILASPPPCQTMPSSTLYSGMSPSQSLMGTSAALTSIPTNNSHINDTATTSTTTMMMMMRMIADQQKAQIEALRQQLQQRFPDQQQSQQAHVPLSTAVTKPQQEQNDKNTDIMEKP